MRKQKTLKMCLNASKMNFIARLHNIKILRFIPLTLLFFILIIFPCCSKASSKKSATKYVASTSWVASIAELAGIDDVEIITPVNLRHPPEYEITPDDMLKIVQADVVMYAGYERMVKVMLNAAEVDDSKLLKVKTTNTLENISSMVEMLSTMAGTQEKAQKRFAGYQKLIEETRLKIKQEGLDKLTAFVNVNQAELARDLGLNVAATFGTAPLSSEQIADAAKNHYDLIIDNIHNPVAAPALEVSPSSKLLVWRNFPEVREENSFYKVIKANCDMIFY